MVKLATVLLMRTSRRPDKDMPCPVVSILKNATPPRNTMSCNKTSVRALRDPVAPDVDVNLGTTTLPIK
jgi:hypothetical protein